MNKNEFLAQLKNKLRVLPADEAENALAYYNEYFDEAGPENEQSVIAGLGSPAETASKIIGEFAVKNIENDAGKTTKSHLNMVWFVILGIFASPIALPLAFAAAAVVFALVVAVFSVLFTLGVTSVALVLGGIVTFFSAVILLFSDFSTAVFFIGVSFLMAAGGILLAMPLGHLSKAAFSGIVKWTAKLLKRGK